MFPEAGARSRPCLRSGTMTPVPERAGPKKAAITAGEGRANLQEDKVNIKEMEVC